MSTHSLPTISLQCLKRALQIVLVLCALGAGMGRVRADERPLAAIYENEIKADLEALHAALLGYLKAHDGVWPQPPQNVAATDAEGAWWVKILKANGASDDALRFSADEQKRALSYQVTLFDAKPMTAFRWLNQPWIVPMSWMNPDHTTLTVCCDGKAFRTKTTAEMKPHPTIKGAFIDPERQGACPINFVPDSLRVLFEDVKKGWKD